MSCEGLISRFGYSCREIDRNVIAIDTPFAFADGETISFYLHDEGNKVILHDNADLLMHFFGVGWDGSDRRNWKGVKNIAISHGFELRDDGLIIGEQEKRLEESLITKFTGFIHEILNFELEYFGLTEEQETYIREVEMALRASDPIAQLDFLPSIEGHSGKKHSFHFNFAGTLIDAARPHGGRTGSILRKAADIRNQGITTPILVVMDDREDQERARAETDILNTMISVVQFSVLNARGWKVKTQH